MVKEKQKQMESSLIIFQQMLVLIGMIAIGFFVYRLKWVEEITEQQLSKLVVSVFNPVLVISGVVGRNDIGSRGQILENFKAVFLYYVIVIVLGYLGSWILRPKKGEKIQYQLMFVFSNVGFMGIPVISALYGKDCLLYITFYLLAYNLLLYTYGIAVAKKSRGKGEEKRQGMKQAWKGLVNPGVAACIGAIMIFGLRIPVPKAAVTFFDYVGNATIPLSMIIIGISVAKMPWRKIFLNVKTYFFCGIKLLLVPVLASLLFRPLFGEEMVFGIFILMLSMPVGSIVTMIFNEYGKGESICSQGIILSTLMSMLTIPIVSLFL